MLQRSEYPRPQFVRDRWITLNGQWDFAFDDENQGVLQEWYKDTIKQQQIIVPFAYQSEASGIHDTTIHPVVWYQRSFSIPSDWQDDRVVLNFNAVDYLTMVWVNGKYVGTHKGGYVGFKFDITDYLVEGENQVTIRVEDHPSINQPRGKQTARAEGCWACWYTPVTGIWQSVWLEAVGTTSIDHVKLEPNIENDTVKVHYWLNNFSEPVTLKVTVKEKGQVISETSVEVARRHHRYGDLIPRNDGSFTIAIPEAKLWSPEEPHLYDLEFRVLQDEKLLDEVKTYVGMRQISVKNGKIHLNNEPYYLRMVLDQGFWPRGIYTPESIDEIKYDVEMTKAFGFNGARKHQKFEDPYYYYYCDQLGLLTWCEMAACYFYDEEVSLNMTDEWQRLVVEHYNYPSVMAWVPVNESWGVDQLVSGSKDPRLANHMNTLYYLTKSLDTTRLVVGNDGWQMAITDIIAIHDYNQDAKGLKESYAAFKEDRHARSFTNRLPMLLDGYEYTGQPIMVTEFGGVKVKEQQAEGWGYGEDAESYDDMVERIDQLVTMLEEEEEICGFCYTQLTDVMQEVNGLLTYDRQVKVDPAIIAKIFGRKQYR